MPFVTRRRTILAASAFALPKTAGAQSFPTRPVTLVVSQGPGSGSDISSRILATQMAPILRQPVVVENRTAGGGWVPSGWPGCAS
jgi:tripartite-type tricarboxylate transporter receptor subunit TctC